ncbi:beta-lactamase/transpeptidase-like protein [Mycena rebaudengoi]|nr:beta-lactamase/transpeptidase-like protein [Mycena rebaudengoi]
MPSRSFLSLVVSCLATAGVALGFDSHQPLSISTVLTPKIDAAIADILRAFKDSHGSWVLESKGYGNASSDGHKKITADTLVAIGSNSKVCLLFSHPSLTNSKISSSCSIFLATGLLISNETLTPRISWTSKIASLIPGWKLMDPIATSESTIVDLMSHRTGLPRHDFMVPISASVPEVIARLQYLKPSTGFREIFQYNNHMYTTLSYLPTVLLNTTFEDYVHENILKPLGMDHTTYFYADAIKTGNLADSFARDGPNTTENLFAQGIIRTLAFWDQTENHQGKNQLNKTVIPSEVIRKVATGVSVIQPVAGYPELSPVVYGGGQMRGTYRGHGDLSKYTPSTSFYISSTDHRLGVAVLSNDDSLGTLIMESVKYRILDSFFRLEPIDWTARQIIIASYVTFLINGFRYRAAVEEARDSVPPPSPPPKDAEPPSAPFASLAGTYKDLGYGTVDFCLFTLNTTTNSESCDRLAAEVPTILPGVIDPDVPTLITKWDTGATNYALLTHYSGNLFNVTGLFSRVSRIEYSV